MTRTTMTTMKRVCLFCVLALVLSGCDGMQLGSMRFPGLGQTEMPEEDVGKLLG